MSVYLPFPLLILHTHVAGFLRTYRLLLPCHTPTSSFENSAGISDFVLCRFVSPFFFVSFSFAMKREGRIAASKIRKKWSCRFCVEKRGADRGCRALGPVRLVHFFEAGAPASYCLRRNDGLRIEEMYLLPEEVFSRNSTFRENAVQAACFPTRGGKDKRSILIIFAPRSYVRFCTEFVN